MRVMYTSTVSVSSEKSATSGQILPILQKLEDHFTVKEEDTMFVSNLKEKVWGNLSGRYQDQHVQEFLHEATALDPRFKTRPVSTDTWNRLKKMAISTEQAPDPDPSPAAEHAQSEAGVDTEVQPQEKKPRLLWRNYLQRKKWNEKESKQLSCQSQSGWIRRWPFTKAYLPSPCLRTLLHGGGRRRIHCLLSLKLQQVTCVFRHLQLPVSEYSLLQAAQSARRYQGCCQRRPIC